MASKDVQLSSDQRQQLIKLAIDSKAHSFSPYSKFRVGAALLASSGKIYTGCNVENASYGGCICAERTAYVKAVSEGERSFVACAVSTDVNDFCSPCGICRQFMSEFGVDTLVIMAKPDGTFRDRPLSALLPDSFGTQDLERNNAQQEVA
ncbi:hypothetical protein RI367_002268 [Sorochytrium milnesiophthora]